MINLFVNYYVDQNPLRQAEIDLCFSKNFSNPLLNVVVLNSQERLKYTDYFRVINQYSSGSDINIIANSDIFFDNTISLTVNMTYKSIYALSRWDWSPDGSSKHFNRKDSQDCWIVKGPITDVNGEFFLGYRGCDNRIAHEFTQAGYQVSNPSLTIKTYHVHNTNIRNYKYTSEYLVPGPYSFIPPTSLIL
jgi:hypothetical protein